MVHEPTRASLHPGPFTDLSIYLVICNINSADVQLFNADSIEVAAILIAQDPACRPLVLNLASANHPGGGFKFGHCIHFLRVTVTLKRGTRGKLNEKIQLLDGNRQSAGDTTSFCCVSNNSRRLCYFPKCYRCAWLREARIPFSGDVQIVFAKVLTEM